MFGSFKYSFCNKQQAKKTKLINGIICFSCLFLINFLSNYIKLKLKEFLKLFYTITNKKKNTNKFGGTFFRAEWNKTVYLKLIEICLLLYYHQYS